jgi:trimeric autotransporter adhesin
MRALVVATALAASAALASAQPVGTAFTYQGRLTDAGNPASGAYDLQLALFDAASGGAQVGATLTRDDVVVTTGLFTVSLDFGAVFAGSKRWLEIRVRPGASTGAYTTLAGRQELTPSPNAAFASGVPWTGVANKPAGFADDVDNDSGGDITGVTAGTGLTGGGATGSVTLNANLAGSGSAATIARSDHDHFAQGWSGASPSGLTVTNTAGGALRGLSTATGATPGVFGSGQSSTGVGVHGQALATSGATRGVLGESASLDGAGVYGTNASGGSAIVGRTTATAGGNAIVGITEGAGGFGVTGAALTTGRGVYGSSQTTSGTGAGVHGFARSPQATAGFFENIAGGPAIVLGGGDILFSDGTSQSTAALGDVTGVAAGFGLTGGGTSGDLTLAVNLQGSGTATTVSRSDHDHLTQAWVGSAPGFQTLRVTNTATGGFSDGIWGQGQGLGMGRGVVGYASGPTGENFGVWGQADSTGGRGVYGVAIASSGPTYGTYGQSDSTVGRGVFGRTTATTGVNHGVYGENASTTPGSAGVFGRALGTGPVSGIEGRANTSVGNAIYAQNESTAGGIGVAARGVVAIYGEGTTFSGTGVFGLAPQVGGNTVGVRAQTDSQTGKGLWAIATNGNGTNYALYAENPQSTSGYAGYFTGLPSFGRVHITGTLSKGMGSFKIDHPLDPANKYLYHSFVESPDMMNIYNGNVVTDADGYATVELPDWFEALNRDFRYQLTVVDEADSPGFVQAKIVRKVADHRFTLRTSAPGVEVSWQVTGIRHDAIAEKHRIPVEEDKPEAERGKYLYPVEQGQPAEKGVDWERSLTALERREANGTPKQ